MKALPPLMILCHGSGDAWTARVLKVGTAGGKWRRPDEGDGREATAGTARDAVLKAITLQGKGPRVCRRCARTWECKRGRTITICPQCQTRKAEPTQPTPTPTLERVRFVVGVHDPAADRRD